MWVGNTYSSEKLTCEQRFSIFNIFYASYARCISYFMKSEALDNYGKSFYYLRAWTVPAFTHWPVNYM